MGYGGLVVMDDAGPVADIAEWQFLYIKNRLKSMSYKTGIILPLLKRP